MKIPTILIAFLIVGCSTQPVELTQAAKDIHVFHEEPKVAYEVLRPINTTSPGRTEMDVLEKVLNRAAELGANGVIVHAIRNKGTVAGGHDTYGTGGGGGVAVYQIQASAIRYVE